MVAATLLLLSPTACEGLIGAEFDRNMTEDAGACVDCPSPPPPETSGGAPDAAADRDASGGDTSVLDGGNGVVRAEGRCTIVDRPKRLICPQGMSCYCEEDPRTLAKDAPSFLDVRTTATAVEILSGSIPKNTFILAPPYALLPLVPSDGGLAGEGSVYRVAVHASKATIALSADGGNGESTFCGSNGQSIRCGFETP